MKIKPWLFSVIVYAITLISFSIHILLLFYALLCSTWMIIFGDIIEIDFIYMMQYNLIKIPIMHRKQPIGHMHDVGYTTTYLISQMNIQSLSHLS